LTTTITGLSAGTTYYVQVKAKESTDAIIDQTGIVSCHTSDTLNDAHLVEFAAYMSTEGDFYMFDETEGYHFFYIMSEADPEYEGYDVYGYIRYIHHFGDNIERITITDINNVKHNFDDSAAGVIIIEVDRDHKDSYNWAYIDDYNFVAVYYYGGSIDEDSGVYASVYMGIAAEPNPYSPPLYATPSFETLKAAIAESVGNVDIEENLQDRLEEYIKEPAEYSEM
jgi:hypothetical protein